MRPYKVKWTVSITLSKEAANRQTSTEISVSKKIALSKKSNW